MILRIVESVPEWERDLILRNAALQVIDEIRDMHFEDDGRLRCICCLQQWPCATTALISGLDGLRGWA